MHLSAIARGAFQSANVGYALDVERQGNGLMHEALSAVSAEACGPCVRRHRVQAAWRPEYVRSGAVLRRLDFADVGLAQDCLYIDGAWRNHVVSQLINPDCGEPPPGTTAVR